MFGQVLPSQFHLGLYTLILSRALEGNVSQLSHISSLSLHLLYSDFLLYSDS